MSQESSISNYVHERFQEAFGPPHNTLGKDAHWRFQSSPDAIPINVLLYGTFENAAIWVFDAHDRNDSVFSASITHKDQVNEILRQIQQRVKRAGRPSDPPGAAGRARGGA